MQFESGSIVTVTDESYIFCGKQGEVLGIEECEGEQFFVVKFPACLAHLLDFDYESRKEPLIHFKEHQLRKDNDYTLENKARMLFGSMYHSLSFLSHPFVPGRPCMMEQCTNKITKRATLNCWGTVFERDVCDNCFKKYHGKCGEYDPSKKNYPFAGNHLIAKLAERRDTSASEIKGETLLEDDASPIDTYLHESGFSYGFPLEPRMSVLEANCRLDYHAKYARQKS